MTVPPKPLPLADAQAKLLDAVVPLGPEMISLAGADGRYLAADIVAQRTQPPADLSAMDGYAVRAEEIKGPWTLVGESAAGHPFAGTLASGQAVRISTGAHLPDGAGAILLQEIAVRDGDALRVEADGSATARHIRRAGFDFVSGDRVLKAGDRLNPARIALALAAGHSELPVGRQPQVAVIDSGDELSAEPSSNVPHAIPASNGIMLAAMAAPFAYDVRRIGPIPDRIDALLDAFDNAAACDVIVTSGGASVGDHDLVRPALEKWGASIAFWRIAMKPGKPLLVAHRGDQIIVGLPGNPVSGYVTAFLFVLPMLRKLAGAAAPLPATVRVALDGTLGETGERLEFIRATLGAGSVRPANEQDSSALTALGASNALIRREIGAVPAAQDSMVEVYPLHNGGIA